MADLKLTGISKRFNDKLVVNDVSLQVSDGEFFALLGPSGCGKSTLLRLIAGFERLDAGCIEIDGEQVSGPHVHIATESRALGMVFQSYALWPHMTVAENVGFALEVQGIPVRQRRVRILHALEVVGLQDFAERRPAELSGGQRQRVALARTLAAQARIILLDEPLANLDANLRESMQDEFRRLHRESGATMVFVTHDQAEALALADRVAVMMSGRFRQIDSPIALYARPLDEDIARFIGRGSVAAAQCLKVMPGKAVISLAETQLELRADTRVKTGPALASLRPEDCHIHPINSAQAIKAEVVATRFTGPAQLVTVRLCNAPNITILATAPSDLVFNEGDRVGLSIQDGWVLSNSHSTA